MMVAPGHSFNSGATLLQSSGFPIATLDSKLCFNEVTFGFVPHGGASYYLSRLPGEVGTFLALTGLPMIGIDAKELKLVDQILH
jgi:enoyl-CoA hydratase/carnithine racemase